MAKDKASKSIMENVSDTIAKKGAAIADGERYIRKQEADVKMLHNTIGSVRPNTELAKEAVELQNTFVQMGYSTEEARNLAHSATFGTNDKIHDAYQRMLNADR